MEPLIISDLYIISRVDAFVDTSKDTVFQMVGKESVFEQIRIHMMDYHQYYTVDPIIYFPDHKQAYASVYQIPASKIHKSTRFLIMGANNPCREYTLDRQSNGGI